MLVFTRDTDKWVDSYIKYIKIEPWCCDFEIYKVISWGICNEPIDKELYINGFIKWDGCMELEFHDTHFCSYSSLKFHLKVLQELYQRIPKVIKGFDYQCANCEEFELCF